MKNSRLAAITVSAALVLTALGLGTAHAISANSANADVNHDAAAVPAAEPSITVEQTVEPSTAPVLPAAPDTPAAPETPASPAAVALGVNGSSGDREGIPYYDARSDPSLIAYPADWPEEERANARLWVQLMHLTATCMESKGHDFHYILWWERPDRTHPNWESFQNAVAPHGTPAFEALWGNPDAPGYDPQVGGGCDGEARAQLWDNPLIHAN